MNFYEKKYLKYKQKYLDLKESMRGGATPTVNDAVIINNNNLIGTIVSINSDIATISVPFLNGGTRTYSISFDGIKILNYKITPKNLDKIADLNNTMYTIVYGE